MRFVALLLALATACGDGASASEDPPQLESHAGFAASIEWPDGSLRRGANDFVVRVANADGSPAALVRLEGLMPLHGHTAYPVSIESLGDGRFAVHDLDLLMAGDWDLALTLSHTGAYDDEVVTYHAAVE